MVQRRAPHATRHLCLQAELHAAQAQRAVLLGEKEKMQALWEKSLADHFNQLNETRNELSELRGTQRTEKGADQSKFSEVNPGVGSSSRVPAGFVFGRSAGHGRSCSAGRSVARSCSVAVGWLIGRCRSSRVQCRPVVVLSFPSSVAARGTAGVHGSPLFHHAL